MKIRLFAGLLATLITTQAAFADDWLSIAFEPKAYMGMPGPADVGTSTVKIKLSTISTITLDSRHDYGGKYTPAGPQPEVIQLKAKGTDGKPVVVLVCRGTQYGRDEARRIEGKLSGNTGGNLALHPDCTLIDDPFAIQMLDLAMRHRQKDVTP